MSAHTFRIPFVKHTLILLFVISAFSFSHKKREARVLVFSKTKGFRHESIEEGAAAIIKLGQENNFKVDTTEDASKFTEDNLKKYSAIIFLNTTLDILDLQQQNDFERYIQSGGGYVGIHAAADTEYDWPWYGKLAGGYFNGHPYDPNVRKGTIYVVDHNHPSTKNLPDKLERTDEFYNFKSMNPEIKVLVKVDEKSYGSGTHGDNHPLSWYHEYDGGRSFYTNFGHTKESYKEPEVLQHILGGIQYAIGENKTLDYSKAKSKRTPEGK